MIDNPASSKTRKLWWHGTSPAHLRSVLKHGLVPTGQSRFVKRVFDDDNRNGRHSIRTFGGTYLTQRISKAGGYACGADLKFRSLDESRALLIGVSLDVRTPSVWVDEDALTIALENVTGIHYYDDFHRLPDPDHKLYELKSWNSKVYFDVERLPEAVAVLEHLEFPSQVTMFLSYLKDLYPQVTKQLAAKRQRAESACQDLIRAFILHLLEMACLDAPHRYKNEESHASLYESSPERFACVRAEAEKTLPLLDQRPTALRNTWQRLAQATDALCKLLPALSLPNSEFSTVRMQEPISYSGKNKIVLVLEYACRANEGMVEGGKFGHLYKRAVTVHYCANPAGLEMYKEECEKDEIFPVFVYPERALQMAANPASNTDTPDCEPEISAHFRGPNHESLYIEWFALPKACRGKGLGRKAYEVWEQTLPLSVKRIYLHAADSGDGSSEVFWDRMGFSFVYQDEEDEDGNSLSLEAMQYMVKELQRDVAPSRKNPADSMVVAEAYAQALDAALPHITFNIEADGVIWFTCPKGTPCMLYPDLYGDARIWSPSRQQRVTTPQQAVAFAKAFLSSLKANPNTSFPVFPLQGWHVTDTEKRSSIERQGLVPKNGKIYVWDTLEMAEWFLSCEDVDEHPKPSDLWEVDTEGLTLSHDPETDDMSEWSSRFSSMQDGGGWFSEQKISPDRLRLVKAHKRR